MTIKELRSDRWARVHSLDGDASLTTRLMEMGFTPGERVRMVAQSPFSDPIAVNIRGSVFALRNFEANCIKIVLE